MLLVFFVSKKDGSKRIVIDYHNLNNQTIKNNYLLLLITDLIDNIGSKRAFTIYIGSLKPTVMFFGMTNLPVAFQVIMNEILRDLINEGKVTTFVINVLVRTETKKEHNKIVEEILRSVRGTLGEAPSHTVI